MEYQGILLEVRETYKKYNIRQVDFLQFITMSAFNTINVQK